MALYSLYCAEVPLRNCSLTHTLFWLYCGFNVSESKNQTVATRWQIFSLKYTKFVVGWGSAQDPAGGPYPDPLAGSS